MKDLKKAFATAVIASGAMVLSACSPPPSETQKPRDGERRLTQGEVTLAQEIFGNQINYNRIFVERSKSSGSSRALNGRISFSQSHYRDDFSQSQNASALSVYFHELTHIWQEQNGVDLASSAVSLFFENGGNYNNAYDYEMSDLPNFSRLGIEQQGEIIEDYVLLTKALKNFNRTTYCPSIHKYEDALKPVFPVIQTPDLCR